jgi:dienelactone hydrolase
MHEQALKSWLGDMPTSDDESVEVTVICTREFKGFTEKKICYEGYDGESIPAYLLIPRGHSHPLPGIVAFHQCGYHCDIGKEQVVGKRVDLPDQAYGFELAKRGFVVLAPDAAKVGERYDPNLREQWQCAHDRPSQNNCCCAYGGSWGQPRWRPVFDAKRAVSVLQVQPEVDPNRMGAIGHSLGADTIIWALPFEERWKAVALSGGGIMKAENGGWMPYEQLLTDIIVHRTSLFEFAGTADPIHRVDGPQLDDVVAHMSKKIDLYNQLQSMQHDVEIYTEACGHCFHENGRVRAYAFLENRLGSKECAQQPHAADAEELRR